MDKIDLTPFVMGAFISNTLEILVAKELLTKQEAASVFAKSASEIRQANTSNLPNIEGMARVIEVLANKFEPGIVEGLSTD